MKVIYEITTGIVIRITSEECPLLAEGHAAADVPDSVIAQSITHVHPDGTMDTDQTIVDHMWKAIREYRTKLLHESDWICSITDYIIPDKDKWITYRQGLRDLTKQPNPFILDWPKAPNTIEPNVSEPIVSDTVIANPVVTEPIVSNPVVTDPVVTEPVVTDPVVTDPVVTEPVVSEPTAPITTDSSSASDSTVKSANE